MGICVTYCRVLGIISFLLSGRFYMIHLFDKHTANCLIVMANSEKHFCLFLCSQGSIEFYKGILYRNYTLPYIVEKGKSFHEEVEDGRNRCGSYGAVSCECPIFS